MCRTVLLQLALLLTVALAAGGSSNSSAADDVKPVAPPDELIGKWRLEVTDGKTTRTAVHHFMKDGRVEIDVRLETPDRKVTDLVKRVVVEVEKGHITAVDLSHTDADGVEDVLPPERRRPMRFHFQVKGDELHWAAVDKDGKPEKEAKPSVLKRVKE